MDLDQAPPTIIALLAWLHLGLWHLSGTCLLQRLFKPLPIPNNYQFLLAFLFWMPTTGACALLLHLLGLGEIWFLRAIIALVLVSALPKVYRLTQLLPKNLPKAKFFWLLALLLAIEAFYSAHPMRLYDQLDYHLVVAKRYFQPQDLFTANIAPTTYLSSLTEFSFVWFRAVVDNDLYVTGISQLFSLLGGAGPVLLGAGILAYEKKRMDLFLLLFSFFPFLIPDNDIFHIAKPDAYIAAAAAVYLLLAFKFPKAKLWLFTAFSLAFVPVKLTFAHFVLAMGPCLLLFWQKPDHYKNWTPLLWLSLSFSLCFFAKNLLHTGGPLYPASLTFMPSDLHGDVARAYWQEIKFGLPMEPFIERLKGPFMILMGSYELIIWLLMVAILIFIRRKKKQVSLTKEAYVFLVLYWLIWPFFFHSQIYTRFVLPFIFSIGVLVFVSLQKSAPIPKWLLAASCLLALASSHVDVSLRKIISFSQMPAHKAMADQWPRYETSLFFQKNGPGDLVILDRPPKAYFPTNILEGNLVPRQRNLWQSFINNAQKTAKKHSLIGIVRQNPKIPHSYPDPRMGPVDDVWDRLRPYGKVYLIGEDEVLYSPCYFASGACL